MAKLDSLGLPSDTLIVGAVGNIKPVKGCDVLIDAFRRFNTIGLQRRVILVIVGEVFSNQYSYKKCSTIWCPFMALTTRFIF